jgi:5,6-dimethylbenzimidazole synthase
MSKGQGAFSNIDRKAVYKAIYKRRDIRKEFLPTAIPEKILLKLLTAAHHAGSVGFMQPWNFIVIKDAGVKSQIKQIFQKENKKASGNYSGEKLQKYRSLKLEGIEETPVNICVTCDSTRGGRHVLGRNSIKKTDVFSTCCAIQNLWLAARAEGIGVGWVSILNNHLLKKALNIPKHIKPVAYLCLGFVKKFPSSPMLETAGWRKRLDVQELIFWDNWGKNR